MKSILIIVPVYNEEAILAEVLASIKLAISNSKKYLYDLLVVNDASSDKTIDIVKNLGVRFLDLPVNLGIGGAMQAGYRYAMGKNYDAIVQVDGDGQHVAKDIEKLVDALFEKGVDLVIGSRFLENSTYQHSLFRWFGMLFSRVLLFFASGNWIWDTTSGFRAITRKLYCFFSNYYPLEFVGTVSVAMAVKKNFKLIEIGAQFNPRKSGKSVFTIKNSIYYPVQISLAIFGVLIQKF